MKFSKAQIQYIEKMCIDVDIDEDKIKGLSELLAHVELTEKAAEKVADTCTALTKAGKRCSKKPADETTMCSIHMKSAKKPEPKKVEKEESKKATKNVDEKKREIELLFGEDIE